jgi:predicted ATP-dependent serine protease
VRDKMHVVDQVLRLTGEFLAQLRILRGDSDRAGVAMAFCAA